MSEFAVGDASMAFKWLVEKHNSGKATAITRNWDDEGTRLAALPLMPFEVANALHRRVLRGKLTVRVAAGLNHDLMSLGVTFDATPNFHSRALELTSCLDQGDANNAHYSALTESLRCHIWAAAETSYRTASLDIVNVPWIEEYVAPK